MRATTTAEMLREAIEAVMPAMSKSDYRITLHCVNLDFRTEESRATATDGRWMAVHQIDCFVQEPGSAGIDPGFLKKLLASLDGVTGSVGIASQRDKIQFAIEGFGTIDTKAIEGCPPYDKVWPSGEPQKQSMMGMDAQLLARVAAAFKKGTNLTALKFEFYGDLSPVVVTNGGSRLKVIVMPCRT